MALTDKQKKFVEEYLIDLNATAAAERAEYAHPNKQGPALLVNLGIQEEIHRRRIEQTKRTETDADRIVREIARLAFSDVRKAVNQDGSLKPLHELDDDTAASIASIETLEQYEGTGENRKLVGYTKKLKLWDKNSALDKLCRRFGLYADTKISLKNEVNLNWAEFVEASKARVDPIEAEIAKVKSSASPERDGHA